MAKATKGAREGPRQRPHRGQRRAKAKVTRGPEKGLGKSQNRAREGPWQRPQQGRRRAKAKATTGPEKGQGKGPNRAKAKAIAGPKKGQSKDHSRTRKGPWQSPQQGQRRAEPRARERFRPRRQQHTAEATSSPRKVTYTSQNLEPWNPGCSKKDSIAIRWTCVSVLSL